MDLWARKIITYLACNILDLCLIARFHGCGRSVVVAGASGAIAVRPGHNNVGAASVDNHVEAGHMANGDIGIVTHVYLIKHPMGQGDGAALSVSLVHVCPGAHA